MNAWRNRPRKIVSPIEIKTVYESGLSLRATFRELRRRGINYSRSTMVKQINAMKAAGEIDMAKRQAAIDARGGLAKGGRPRLSQRRGRGA